MTSQNECERLYQEILANADRGSNDSLFRLAQCFIAGFDPNKLRTMLGNADEGIVVDGLFVAQEIGPLVGKFKEQIEALRGHPDADIRRMADSLNEKWFHE